MNEDLNTAVAVSVMFEMVRLASRLAAGSTATTQTLKAVDDQFRLLGGDVLGIVLDEYPSGAAADDQDLLDHLIGSSSMQRKQARARRERLCRSRRDSQPDSTASGLSWRTSPAA